MALTMEEFLARDPNDLSMNTPCAKCNTPLQTSLTGRNQTPEGDICDDCLFDNLGEIVERSPIGPRGQHGPSP